MNLIHAWKQVMSSGSVKHCEWRLDIAGWDQHGHTDELEQLVQVHGLGSSVRFLGPMFGEAKRKSFLDSQAFVLPSYSEGFPMAVLEACPTLSLSS